MPVRRVNTQDFNERLTSVHKVGPLDSALVDEIVDFTKENRSRKGYRVCRLAETRVREQLEGEKEKGGPAETGKGAVKK